MRLSASGAERMISLEVIHVVNETTRIDKFTADSVDFQIWDSGRAIVNLENGKDADGPISVAMYANAQRITRRPLPDEKR